MRSLKESEITLVSGGFDLIDLALLGGISTIAVVLAVVSLYSIRNHSDIDFSQLTPEEAYQKGLHDCNRFGYFYI